MNDIWYLDISLNQFHPHQFMPPSNFFNGVNHQGNPNMYGAPFQPQQHQYSQNDNQRNRRKYMVGGGTG